MFPSLNIQSMVQKKDENLRKILTKYGIEDEITQKKVLVEILEEVFKLL